MKNNPFEIPAESPIERSSEEIRRLAEIHAESDLRKDAMQKKSGVHIPRRYPREKKENPFRELAVGDEIMIHPKDILPLNINEQEMDKGWIIKSIDRDGENKGLLYEKATIEKGGEIKEVSMFELNSWNKKIKGELPEEIERQRNLRKMHPEVNQTSETVFKIRGEGSPEKKPENEEALTEAERIAGITPLDKLMGKTPLDKLREEGKRKSSINESELPPDIQLANKVAREMEEEQKRAGSPENPQ